MSRTAIVVNTRSVPAVDTGATITITEQLSDELSVTGLGVSLGVLLSSTGLKSVTSLLGSHCKAIPSSYCSTSGKGSLYPAQLWAEMFTDRLVLYIMSKL